MPQCGVGWQIVGSLVFGYFALASLINARLGIVNREKAPAEFGPDREDEGRRFLRVWLAVNLLSFIVLAGAAVMLWVSPGLAVLLALAPIPSVRGGEPTR